MRYMKLFIWSGIIGLNLIAYPLYADFYLHPWEDHFESQHFLLIEPEFKYSTSKNNFGPSGTLTTPSGLKNYSRTEFDLAGTYGLHPKVSLFARLNWQRNDISHDSLPGNVFGFGDQSLGITFRALQPPPNPLSRRPTLDFQFQTDLPLYNNKTATTNKTPFLSDGSNDFTFGSFLSFPIVRSSESSLYAFAGMGYTWRSAGFSAAFPWSLSAKYTLGTDGLFFDLGLSGFQSTKTDANAAVGNTAGAGSGGSGSFFINAINPSLMTLRGQVGYQIDPSLGVLVSFNQSLFGQAAPSVFNISFGLQAHLNMKGKAQEERPANPATLSPQEYGKSNKGFVDYAFEAEITRVSDRLNLLKIGKGSQDGVEVGQVFDIFVVGKNGNTGDPIARAECTHVKSGEAALKITEYFKEIWIEEGFVVRKPLQ